MASDWCGEGHKVKALKLSGGEVGGWISQIEASNKKIFVGL